MNLILCYFILVQMFQGLFFENKSELQNLYIQENSKFRDWKHNCISSRIIPGMRCAFHAAMTFVWPILAIWQVRFDTQYFDKLSSMSSSSWSTSCTKAVFNGWLTCAFTSTHILSITWFYEGFEDSVSLHALIKSTSMHKFQDTRTA